MWKNLKQKRLSDEAYKIAAIVQTGPEKEALKTAYLAELLSLSIDQPTHLYRVDLKRAVQKLLSSPLIADARVKRMPPNTLYIDYEVRRPVAWLSDYKNIGIDQAGFLFPMTPFFSPKNLPEIYLGLPAFGAPEDSFGRKGGAWLSPIKNRYLNLAFEVLQYLEGSSWKEGLQIKRIDVSNAFAPSLGQREIVLFTEEEITVRRNEKEIACIFPKILRLAPKEYHQQLANFIALRRSMVEDYRRQMASLQLSCRFAPRIIDLRIPQLAFIENDS
ncbi:MAG: hypothetical protein A3E80_01420 [Chlamydiae bacterium RIFCSPHIGHO2_12_FULL_49_9]|nr:MAG: hypothetical protein A3E80_01420 [Chlamydiae bacterium RIFCSPHIGHO2_12_FULL_49_9]